ncbi:hypothetical protein NP493_11g02015 [Ridgeia piscesae]|uniref:PDEase domain-containing protein n=1 Tax=Ridgeia piscesae TaxID=27915 RepID=A0AAD9PFH1_RIDPI|nr:hypothetical protein NP493_11g02015 [Ridgeia piscesae]
MHLSPSEYRRAIKIVEAAIMATDLALYFKKRGGFEKLVNAGETKWDAPEKRDLLRAMMMTACDVAAITKPWEIQKDVAQLVANEFFEQGDLERFKLHQEPIAMMDRQKKDELPSMQVGFIDSICLPVYKHLARAFPALKPMVDGCLRNRAQWQSLAEEATANG